MTIMKDSENVHEAETTADYVVCFSSFFILFLCEAVSTCYGLFILELQDYFDSDSASLAMVGSALVGCSMFAGPIVSLLLERWCVRTVLIGGSVITALGFAVSSLSTSVLMLTLTFGVVSGLSFGVVYVTAIVMVGLRFDRRRALATGIALSGAGVGVLVLSYPIDRLLTEYGWRGTALIISGIFLNCCVFAAMIFPKKTSGKQEDPSVIAKDNFDRKDEHLVFPYRTRHGDNKRDQCAGNPLLHGSFPIIYIHTTPTRAEDDTKGIEFRQQTKSAVIVSSQNPKIWCSEPLLSFNPTEKLRSVDTQLDEQRDAKRIPQGTEGKLTLWLRRHLYLSTNVSFHMLLFVMCLYTGMFQVIMYLPDLAVSRGLSRPEAALLLSAFGVTNVIGRILVGALSNLRRVDSTVLYAAGLLLLALNTTVLPHCSSLPHFVTASIVFGLCCASCISLRTVVIADVMSSDLLVDAFGVICVAQGVCYMVLPSLCGRLYQSSGGFVGPLYLIAAMCGTSAIMCGLLKPLKRWQNAHGTSR